MSSIYTGDLTCADLPPLADFDKWVDEDEQDAAEDPAADMDMSGGMPGMGGGGMNPAMLGGMPGMMGGGGPGGFDMEALS